LFINHCFVFVVELEFNLDQLVFFDAVCSGDRETHAAPGDVGDVDESSANPSFAQDDIGPIEVGLFAIISSKVDQDRKNLLATATDRKGMRVVAETISVKMFDRAAIWTDQGGCIVFSDVNFLVSHDA
jgi:hypothetical protein